MRAAREGAARLNLRLLAKAIAGKLRSGSLVAGEFLQYAEALGSAVSRRDYRSWAVYKVWAEHQDLAATNPMEAAKYTDPWVLALRKLTTQGMAEELVAGLPRGRRDQSQFMGWPRLSPPAMARLAEIAITFPPIWFTVLPQRWSSKVHWPRIRQKRARRRLCWR